MNKSIKSRLVAIAFIVLLAIVGISHQSHAGKLVNPAAAAGGGSSATIGDIKWAYLTANHNGWYKCNGLSIGSLPPVQAARANALGLNLIGTLPDLQARGITGESVGATMGTYLGQGQATLSQGNLPNVAFSVSTETAGTPSGTIASVSAGVPSGTITSVTAGTPSGSVSIGVDGAHTHSLASNTVIASRGVASGSAYNMYSSSGNFTGINSDGITQPTIGGAGAHSHTASFSGATLPTHTHTFTGTGLTAHNHGFTGSPLPVHNHTVLSGGSSLPINTLDPTFVANAFIYLGL